MKNILLPVLVSTPLLFACGPEDPSFCDCLDATEKLNETSSKIINGDYDMETIEEQKILLREKDSLCKAYREIDGETSRRLKKSCEDH